MAIKQVCNGACSHGTGYVDLGTNMLDTTAATIEIWARPIPAPGTGTVKMKSRHDHAPLAAERWRLITKALRTR